MDKRRLTDDFKTPHIIYLAVSLLMVVVSIYLTKHFYNIHFPSGFGGEDALCKGTGFWGCNKATQSALGHFFFVPTSLFGIIIGLLGLIGAFWNNSEVEKTNKFFVLLNALGCLGLLGYSLIALGGLCQFCTVYYVLSFIAAFLFLKHSSLKPIPSLKVTAVYGVLLIIPALLMRNYFVDQSKKQNSLSGQYIQQYKNLPNKGEPNFISPYKINEATEQWNDAPVRIAVFSDFQCPFCQKVAEQIPQVIQGLEDKINVSYYFYPLDNACNPKITRSFHQYACKAAYLAACDVDKFEEVHDVIFERQRELSYENLDKWAQEF
ncbi:MAG: thioredoxin domain-containing protein, partial [Bacteriovoracaceae bacterium]|nr:thioredoxin domain-containing protein [Bacteriovoracaceae bacterium]